MHYQGPETYKVGADHFRSISITLWAAVVNQQPLLEHGSRVVLSANWSLRLNPKEDTNLEQLGEDQAAAGKTLPELDPENYAFEDPRSLGITR